MTRDEFRDLLLRALSTAADNAEARLGGPVPRSFDIELHAPGSSGQLVNFDWAVDQLYLGRDRFYRIIDVAICRLLRDRSVAVCPGERPHAGPFDRTWDPSNLGPFKQIAAETIEQPPLGAA